MKEAEQVVMQAGRWARVRVSRAEVSGCRHGGTGRRALRGYLHQVKRAVAQGRLGRGWVGMQGGVEGFPRVCPSPALHTPPRWSGAGGFELLMPVIKCFLRYWVFWCDQFSQTPGLGRPS